MKNIIIIGVGRRVRDDILPTLEASGLFTIIGIYARSARELNIGDRKYSVKPLDELKSEDLKNTDWVYLGVPPKATFSVLRYLSHLHHKNANLLLDTPVLPWKHQFAKIYFHSFSKVVVSEDIIYLPWIEPVKKFLGGKISELVFDGSAYGYHGIALIKALTGCLDFNSARLKFIKDKKIIDLETISGVHVQIIEPRDYKNGNMRFSGLENSVTDGSVNSGVNMLPIISDGVCIGLHVGNLRVDFSSVETKLIGPVTSGATVTSLTLELKRVGLLKMWTLIAEGKPAGKSVSDATADTRLNELVHYFGKWINVA